MWWTVCYWALCQTRWKLWYTNFSFFNVFFNVFLSAKVSTAPTYVHCVCLVRKFLNFTKPSFSSLVSLGEDAEDEDGEDDSDEQRETEADSEENPGLGLDHAARWLALVNVSSSLIRWAPVIMTWSWSTKSLGICHLWKRLSKLRIGNQLKEHG